MVRLSGRDALAVAGKLVSGIAGFPERQVTRARLLAADGAVLDDGLVTVFRAPRSYTGEDLVELSCHGGMLASAQLLAALFAAGARLAQPGEFTRRALLNGKLDLLQAEAIGDLIDATAAAQGRAALQQLEGGLSRRVLALREALLELSALLAYDIDFPEEDDGPVPTDRIRGQLEMVAGDITALLATAPTGLRLREGALVVFAGRPNTGKSSLFNALLGIERSLVTELPGTTRDTVEAFSEIAGWPVRLADTAGLREAGERLERMGIEVSRRYVAAADLLLLCVEADRRVAAEEEALLAESGGLLVRTKADLTKEVVGPGRGVAVSVVSGEGLDHLKAAIAERLVGSDASSIPAQPILTRERHQIVLARAAEALEAARPELGKDAVLAAHHVREAVTALEELIGLVHPDEVLGRVFERFCVGK